MTTHHDQQPSTSPRPDQDVATTAPDGWFSAAAEAANCVRVLGHRRHGLDSRLPGRRAAPGGP